MKQKLSYWITVIIVCYCFLHPRVQQQKQTVGKINRENHTNGNGN